MAAWLRLRAFLAIAALAAAVVSAPASAHTAATTRTQSQAQVHAHFTSAAVRATLCSRGYYRNVSGHCVHEPASSPVGATAQCRDGTYSYSEHASGTCSHHGGVRRWIHHP